MSENSQQAGEAPATRQIPPKPLTLKACQTDDVSLMSQALTAAAQPNARSPREEILTQAVRQSIRRGSNKVLSYVLENGAKVPSTSSLAFDEAIPPKETFEILLQHGWDINAREAGERPFLWNIVHIPELVEWALEHGAKVVPQEPNGPDPAPNRQEDCPALLETAVSYGASISTFELLRSKGAQLGARSLHFAARSASFQSNQSSDQDGPMALVRHLVDAVKLDVNALDQPPGWTLGNHWGTPLCYVAEVGPQDCREVTRFLLERGADPHLKIEAAQWDAVTLAEQRRNQKLIDTVEQWESEKSNGA